jgi:hypothetical protein
MEMATAITQFFISGKSKLSRTILEYMIKAILIHLDDQNEKVQK